MSVKSFEYYVAQADENKLAEKLVKLDMDAAAALYQALGAHLQDAAVEAENELVERLLDVA